MIILRTIIQARRLLCKKRTLPDLTQKKMLTITFLNILKKVDFIEII